MRCDQSGIGPPHCSRTQSKLSDSYHVMTIIRELGPSIAAHSSSMAPEPRLPSVSVHCAMFRDLPATTPPVIRQRHLASSNGYASALRFHGANLQALLRASALPMYCLPMTGTCGAASARCQQCGGANHGICPGCGSQSTGSMQRAQSSIICDRQTGRAWRTCGQTHLLR